MPRKRYTEEQIGLALRQAEAGTPVTAICRKLGITEPTFYRWQKRFESMGVADIRRLKQLEEENRQLKQLVGPRSIGWRRAPTSPIRNRPRPSCGSVRAATRSGSPPTRAHASRAFTTNTSWSWSTRRRESTRRSGRRSRASAPAATYTCSRSATRRCRGALLRGVHDGARLLVDVHDLGLRLPQPTRAHAGAAA